MHSFSSGAEVKRYLKERGCIVRVTVRGPRRGDASPWVVVMPVLPEPILYETKYTGQNAAEAVAALEGVRALGKFIVVVQVVEGFPSGDLAALAQAKKYFRSSDGDRSAASYNELEGHLRGTNVLFGP